MKYKLIKEYPGSENLGYEVSSDCGTLEWKGTNFYEKYPEYWEKVNEYLWWVVFTKEEALFKTYTPYLIETYAYHVNDSRKCFKTKEEAEEFILFNKPCLSYSDIIWNFEERPKKDDVLIKIDKLIQVIKSKL